MRCRPSDVAVKKDENRATFLPAKNSLVRKYTIIGKSSAIIVFRYLTELFKPNDATAGIDK